MQNALFNTTVQPLQILIAKRLYTPEEMSGPVAVVLEGTKIRSLWHGMNATSARERLAAQIPDAKVEVMDLGSHSLAPGLIDLHIHGSYGYDVTTGSQTDVEALAHALPRAGVTSFFPTIATSGRTEMRQQIQRVTAALENQHNPSSAEMLGLRLEGPFISRAKKGAQYEGGIRPPDSAEMEELAEIGPGWIRIVDFAPEEDVDGSFLATLVRLNILPCIGHTSATYEQALSAIAGGVRHSTHLFNAMSPLDHRAPGVAGALLTDPRATIEIIADGIHIHPAITKLVIAARSFRNVALITDATAPAELPEGEYEFVGRKVIVGNGAVRLENGTLAGSILTLDAAVRNIRAFSGLSWAEAIAMATLVPATIAGMESRKGRIISGADADLIALDDSGFVHSVWTRGQLVYSKEDTGKD